MHLLFGRAVLQAVRRKGKGLHASEVSLKRRTNSTLTYEMEKRVRESMDRGIALCALTNSNASRKELRDQGLDPAEHGWLVGRHQLQVEG